jgi:hypothetical protein
MPRCSSGITHPKTTLEKMIASLSSDEGYRELINIVGGGEGFLGVVGAVLVLCCTGGASCCFLCFFLQLLWVFFSVFF